ncbi:MAG: Spy/CpxP family protein refolding chaperone [Gemmatimonadota bacterium]
MSPRILALLALAVLGTAPLAAQRGRSPARAGATPETAMRLRERLQLTDDQVAKLRAFREEDVAARRDIMNAQLELRSRFRAGEITPEAFREEVRAQREAIRLRNTERGDRVGGVLTDAQRGQLNQLREQRARQQLHQGQAGGHGGRMSPQAGRGPRRGLGGSVRGPGPGRGQHRRLRRPPAGG